MLSMAFFCLLLISETAIGQSIVKDVDITSEEAKVQFSDETPNSYFVEIAGPENYYLKQRVDYKNTLSLSNLNTKGEKFEDGVYTLQITPIITLTEEQRKLLTQLRAINDVEAMAKFRRDNDLPDVVDGYSINFSIKNGKFVSPDLTEGRLNMPSYSSAWEQDHPTLYASVNMQQMTYKPNRAMDHTNTVVDQVILDDLIVQGSICAGFDCVNGESFGFDTLRLKENNLRIKFQDTSTSASFPTRDWQITANDSSNGGANKFSIDDIDGGRTPFTIEAGAPSHSLYVDDAGRIGLGTSTPVVEMHVKDGDTPTLRLEQDGSSGFGPQTWDVASNETNFFIRDATNGSKLPFRIRPGAPQSSLDIKADGGLQFIRYGDGNETGTATKLLAVDVDGNVIEQPISAGGGDVSASDGSAATPSISFASDPDLGIYRIGTDILGFTAAGMERGRITATGNFGLGSNNPDRRVSIQAGLGAANNSHLSFKEGGGVTMGTIGLETTTTNDFLFAAIAGMRFYTQSSVGTSGTPTNEVMRILTSGNVGIGTTAPSHKLEVCGSIGTTSATVTTSITCSSDKRFKKNISPLQNSLEKVLNLQGVNYDWRIDEFPNKHFNEGQQLGFIAQEIEEVLPIVVQTDKEGYKSVDYSRLTPVLAEAIKEQQAIINAQQNQINSLQSELASLQELKAQVAALTQMVMKQTETGAKANTQVGDE